MEIARHRRKSGGKMPAAELMKREADLFLKQILANDWLVLLDRRGTQRTSIELSTMLQGKMNARYREWSC
ncbi:MAG: hypothetical protein R3C05_20275 [Pirellulaceae bacterium]